MPRRRYGRRSARCPAPRPAAAPNPPPEPVYHAPPPAPLQSSSGGSMLENITRGMAFGKGRAVAQRVVDFVMGPRKIQHETVVSQAAAAPGPISASLGGSDACGVHSKAFQDCLHSCEKDINECQFYMDMLAECRRNSGSVMSS